MVLALWQQLLDAITRPPRDIYSEDTLVGGSRGSFRFALSGYPVSKYYRESVVLTNYRGQKLVCSHFRCCFEGIGPRRGGSNPSDAWGSGQASRRSPVVVYLHSNSGSQRDAEEILFNVLQYNISVFALDFAGSGLSDGEYVSLGAYEQDDVQTAVEYLRSLPTVSTIGLWGRSMGAVTALLYAHRDPSIAACVVDSPFSDLIDLMAEIATDTQNGMGLPKSVVKMLLVFMKRSVRKRAKFKLEDVSPKDVVAKTYVPVLFGHGRGDTFIGEWHSERLFERHGADLKRVVTFEGDHNSMRPGYWYDVGMDFLISALFAGEGACTGQDDGAPQGKAGRTADGASEGTTAGDLGKESAEGITERNVASEEFRTSTPTVLGLDGEADDADDADEADEADEADDADEEAISLTPDAIAKRLEQRTTHRPTSPFLPPL